MTTRFKLIAAALGFVVASGAISEASAAVVKTVTTRTVAHTKIVKIATHRAPRLHVGARIVKIVHRAPARIVAVAPVRPVLVRAVGPRHVLASRIVVAKHFVTTKRIVAHRFVTKKVVRIGRHPVFQHHAMFHRAGAKTVIR